MELATRIMEFCVISWKCQRLMISFYSMLCFFTFFSFQSIWTKLWIGKCNVTILNAFEALSMCGEGHRCVPLMSNRNEFYRWMDGWSWEMRKLKLVRNSKILRKYGEIDASHQLHIALNWNMSRSVDIPSIDQSNYETFIYFSTQNLYMYTYFERSVGVCVLHEATLNG